MKQLSRPQVDTAYLSRDDMGIQDFFFRNMSVKEQVIFWDSHRQWFVEKGYTLYAFTDGDPVNAESDWSCFNLTPPPEHCMPCPGDDPQPYAYHGGCLPDDTLSVPAFGMVFFALDAQGHHVAIKFVDGQSQEYHVLRFLHQHSSALLSHHIIPVLDLVPLDENWFAVMPRWGMRPDMPKYTSAMEVLQFTESMLKALVFLHAHYIIHRDLRRHNTLINHFSSRLSNNFLRGLMRGQGRLTSALFDFDLAVVLPSHIRRLPYKFSWAGFPDRFSGMPYSFRPYPLDTAQGEYEYDPYAFDVASLGLTLLTTLSTVSPPIPMMAPLIAGMIHTDIHHRFNAHQALEFFNERVAELSQEEYNLNLDPDGPRKINYLNPWEGLDEDFVRRWSCYRSPPPSLFTRFLRYICRAPRVYALVAGLRRAIDSMTPRHLWFCVDKSS